MSRFGRMVVAFVALLSVWALAGPTSATAAVEVKTCETADGRYDVTASSAGSDSGADPAGIAAANCTLGFDEQNIYPLSVIGLCLIATAVTLVLVRRQTSHDVMGAEA